MADQAVVGKRLVKTFFSPDEYSRIAEQANAEGRAVANWLRHVALTQLANEPTLALGVLGTS